MSAAALRPMTKAERKALQKRIEWWGDHPVDFVLENFGPGYEERHDKPLVPDPWQAEAMNEVAKGTFKRFGFAASKNALKTCTLAWIGLWWLVTRVDAEIVAVSVSGDNLKAGLWKELALWYGFSPLLQQMFSFSAEAIAFREQKYRLTWWCHARSWAQDADQSQQAETLAGLHGPAMMFLGDEAGGLPDGVVAAADAILASEGTDARLILAGNTVRQSGPLYRAVLNKGNLYWVKRISGDPDDPKRCSRVSIEWAKEQLRQCGGDKSHPHYKINVLGEFPDVASEKLLGPDHVDRAMARNPGPEQFAGDPVIVGIDTALQGTDETVLIRRQGCVAFRPRAWRTNDVMVLADQISAELIGTKDRAGKPQPKADAVFIDLGGPSGHGVRDRLKQLVDIPIIGIDFGIAPVGDDAAAPTFANRRAEMAWKCAQWVKDYGSLPEDQQLREELLEPEFWPAKTGKSRWFVEPKDQVKARLSRSPDRCDALWLTFAAPVAPKGLREAQQNQQRQQAREVDPYAVLGGRA